MECYVIKCKNSGMWGGMSSLMHMKDTDDLDKTMIFATEELCEDYLTQHGVRDNKVNNFNSYFVQPTEVDFNEKKHIFIDSLDILDEIDAVIKAAEAEKQAANKKLIDVLYAVVSEFYKNEDKVRLEEPRAYDRYAWFILRVYKHGGDKREYTHYELQVQREDDNIVYSFDDGHFTMEFRSIEQILAYTDKKLQKIWE